jgi:hypothetical protein
MKKSVSFFIGALVISSVAFAQFPKLPGKISAKALPVKPAGKSMTNEDAVAALKDALKVGTDTAVSLLSKTDGFYKDEAVKILLPPEAQNIQKNISRIPGGQQMLDKTILTMNRAAEDASKDAAPIFKNAITSMTVSDGINIVQGDDNAATTYLKGKTYQQLQDDFTPKIKASLSKPLAMGISAEDSYKDLINAYNKASMNGMLYEKITTNSLSEHVTAKGLDGLFAKVALQEKNIRKNPVAQVTDILKKVFGKK